VESGKWKVESGKWKVESGKWKVESGKWGQNPEPSIWEDVRTTTVGSPERAPLLGGREVPSIERRASKVERREPEKAEPSRWVAAR
jgi:hypothetical protein